MPPVVSGRWIKVVELEMPGPSAVTLLSNNQGITVESGVHSVPGARAASILLLTSLNSPNPVIEYGLTNDSRMLDDTLLSTEADVRMINLE